MKILFIHCKYRESGGEDAVVNQEINLLQDQGIHTDLLLFDNEKRSLLNLALLPFNLFSFREVQRRIRKFKPDLVHIHNLHFAGSYSVFRAIRAFGLPFVTTLHNYRMLCPSAILFNQDQIFTESVNTMFPWKAVKAGVYRNSRLLTFWLAFSTWIHRVWGTFRLCDRYIVLTDFSRKLITGSVLNLPASRVTVKPNFTDSPVNKDRDRGNDFLFVGRLTEDKGLSVLLEAFAGAPGWQIHIVGTGPLQELVEQYAARFPNINYHGFREKEFVRARMEEASTLIFPSLWYEGMPMTILESFAAGCPVIASDIGAMQSMIKHGENGMHFQTGSVSSLQNTLQVWTALSSEERVHYQENAVLTYTKHYTPARNVSQLLDIYNSIIQNHPNHVPILA